MYLEVILCLVIHISHVWCFSPVCKTKCVERLLGHVNFFFFFFFLHIPHISSVNQHISLEMIDLCKLFRMCYFSPV